MSAVTAPAIGVPLDRVDGRDKVEGQAAYAYEHRVDGVAYAVPVVATIARGEVSVVDASEALAVGGVLTVLSHENAPRLASDENRELFVLQEPGVAYRGQIVAAVVAESLEAAREAAARVRVEYEQARHDVLLREDHPGLYKPDTVNPSFPADAEQGDPDAALTAAAVSIDRTYATPAYHN